MVGVGIRLVQDVGRHRKKVYSGSQDLAEAEQWRRAFWFESRLSSALIKLADDLLFFSQGPRGSGQVDECVTRSAVCYSGGRVRVHSPGYLVRICDFMIASMSTCRRKLTTNIGRTNTNLSRRSSNRPESHRSCRISFLSSSSFIS